MTVLSTEESLSFLIDASKLPACDICQVFVEKGGYVGYIAKVPTGRRNGDIKYTLFETHEEAKRAIALAKRRLKRRKWP